MQGSTVITLNADYLNSLEVGTYDKFVAEFKDGLFERITLKIVEAGSGSPKIGDGADLLLWIVLALANIGMLVTVLQRKHLRGKAQ